MLVLVFVVDVFFTLPSPSLPKARIIFTNVIYAFNALVILLYLLHTAIRQLLIFSVKILERGTLLPFLKNGFCFFFRCSKKKRRKAVLLVEQVLNCHFKWYFIAF